MMRVFIKLLLSLCVLLLGGYALTCHNGIGYSPKRAFERSVLPGCSSIQYARAEIRKAPSPSTGKGNERIKAIEIADEDEESALFKKQLKAGNDLIAFFNTHASAFIYRYHKGFLPFCEHFSYFSSYKFIIHLVIRI